MLCDDLLRISQIYTIMIDKYPSDNEHGCFASIIKCFNYLGLVPILCIFYKYYYLS